MSIATFDRALARTRAGCDLTPLTFIDAYGLVGTACALRAANEKAIALPRAAGMRAHQVVIGDTGRGIRASFLASGAYAPPTDLAAIDLALEYLVSSVDDPGRGQGLSTTRDQVVETQGRMVIRSGTARVMLDAGGKTYEEVPYLPGVIVALSLPLYPG